MKNVRKRETSKFEPTTLEWIALIAAVVLIVYCGYRGSQRLYELRGQGSQGLSILHL